LCDEHEWARHRRTNPADRADAISAHHTTQSEHVSGLDAHDRAADVVRSATDFLAAEQR
jgi:hypothetical protein